MTTYADWACPFMFDNECPDPHHHHKVVKEFKKFFEANLLDGNKVQDGQMISSSEALAVAAEFIQRNW